MSSFIRGLGYTVTALGAGVSYYYITDTRAGIHQWLVPPIFRLIYTDAELAHEKGTRLLKTLYALGLQPRERGNADEAGATTVFGRRIVNPLGISAGLDKNGEIPDALLALGPAIVEIGGVTPQPQAGNPKPRVFRLPSQNALINRYGLNSEGAAVVAMRLRQRLREFSFRHGLGMDEESEQRVLDGAAGVPPGSLADGKLLAIQVAKNKTTPDDDLDAITADYVNCVEQVAKYADIITVNVSSPNTPGLRALQNVGPLTRILQGVVRAATVTSRENKPAVMVKVSPDEDSDEQIAGICEAVKSSNVDGIIVGNTTKGRPQAEAYDMTISSQEAAILREQGGYSGPLIFGKTIEMVRRYRTELDKSPDGAKKVLFATGGITDGQQVKDVLDAGASVAMVYTVLVYGGVGSITRLKGEYEEALHKKV